MDRVSLRSLRTGTPSVKAYVSALSGQHIVPKDGAWQVKKSGADRATRQFSTQKEAIEFARELALRQQAELFVHGKDGKIRFKNASPDVKAIVTWTVSVRAEEMRKQAA